MSPEHEPQSKPPIAPWDRIFSLGTRAFVWGLLLATLYLLRPFFLLIFLTFVFAYIQAHGVDGLRHRIASRPLRVTIVGLVFLGTILATGFTLLPQLEDQFGTALKKKDEYLAQADKELHKAIKQWPSLANAFGKPKPGDNKPANGNGEPPQNPPPEAPKDPPKNQGEPVRNGETKPTTPQDPQPPVVDDKPKPYITDLAKTLTDSLPEKLPDIGASVLGYVSSFLLSLLFSFLIVLDLPKVASGVAGLKHTRIGFIYEEVADNIATFGRVLGRALEAQLIIAICNTILTAIGIWMMGLPNMLVLSAIVFLCSFIPVAGTFISSTPICLIALQAGGVTPMLLMIGLILLIHGVETYILNPQIYGHHMRMNPVFVLIVLTIAGKLVGVWGLVLGIPIVNYFFRHAIRFPKDQPDPASI